MHLKFLQTLFLLCFSGLLFAQNLKPGFDVEEYKSLLCLAFLQRSTLDSNAIQKDSYIKLYTSQEVGLKNRWWLYKNHKNQAVIIIRGTIGAKESWLENYYCPMLPAQGNLHLEPNFDFKYKLAEAKDAYVHAGWTIGMAYLVRDMMPKIKEQYQQGVRDVIVSGHSQGGALTFLVSAYLFYAQKEGKLPADIRFKVYASAAPKPGNIQFAYDFNFNFRGGWNYSVVNALDWVPETPYSIQRLSDMNDNPILDLPKSLKNQNFFLQVAGNYLFKKLNRKTKNAQKVYTNNLGHTLYKYALKSVLSGYTEADYVKSLNYVQAGTPIVLQPDSAYLTKFNKDTNDKFRHHSLRAYYDLIEQQYNFKN